MEGGGLRLVGFLSIFSLDGMALEPCPFEVLFAEKCEDVVGVRDFHQVVGAYPIVAL